MKRTTDQAIEDIERRVNRQRGCDMILYGLDVGRAKDHSALSIVARVIQPADSGLNTLVTQYFLVYMERYPLQTPYTVIEMEAKRFWDWADAAGLQRHFIMDMTGVGAPVLEGIRRRGVRAIGVNITGGNFENQPEPMQYNVPKAALVTTLIKTFQDHRIKGYATLKAWEQFKQELGSFGYKINSDATVTYESASEKVHDDIVISVALPIWYGERVRPFRGVLRGGGAEVDHSYNPMRPIEE